jgi:conjugative transfer signal peptidase TraF
MTRAGRTCLVAAAGLALIAFSAAERNRPTLVWNASASVPIGLYAILPSGGARIGDLFAVRPPDDLAKWLEEAGYLGHDLPLLKRLAARAGAEVCRNVGTIRVDGAAVAIARARDRRGRPLPVWEGCRTLAAGEVFLLNANAPASLDGRYFGPLGAEAILGRAIPLWTRGG